MKNKTSHMELNEANIRAIARELIASIGPRSAVRVLGVSRDTVLGLAAGARVQSSTFALIRERYNPE